MSYKRLIPCIFIKNGKGITWFDDDRVIHEDVVALAKYYCNTGADELLVFDLSRTDEDHEESLSLVKKISGAITVPMVVGGNIRRAEDVKKILYAGATRAMLNFSKQETLELIGEVSARFGKERIAVSLKDFDELFKRQRLIEEHSSEIIFMHRLDLVSVKNITDLPCVVVTDSDSQEEIINILNCSVIRGISGRFVNDLEFDFAGFKEHCVEAGIKMTTFESLVDFSTLKLDEEGLITVVVQEHKTNEILMVAYMNEDAFLHTIKSGRMTYFSRSRKARWIKGETSGHYQYLKELSVDCDQDTLLAKVEQVGVACHTGAKSCFFEKIVQAENHEKNPLQVFEAVYHIIQERKEHPKEGSYTNYLFDKGVDKILKKIGEEATELVIAAKNPKKEEIKYELADFLYHAMVLMVEKEISWDDVVEELAKR